MYNKVIPERTMIKVAVGVLTKGYSDIDQYSSLLRRTESLVTCNRWIHNNPHYQIDYLIFHEGNISGAQQDFIADKLSLSAISFIDVAAEFAPQQNLPNKHHFCHKTKLSERFSHGYKCMCLFWLDGFLGYTHGYDYVVRADEDCFFNKLDLHIILDEMKSRHASYASLPSGSNRDHPDVTVGLEAFCNHFADIHNINDSQKAIDYLPYTNFFVINRQHYSNNSLFLDFCRRVRDTQCVHINRWGDRPLWGQYLAIAGDVLYVPRDIEYVHGSHDNALIKSP